jgi:hypothetical protein
MLVERCGGEETSTGLNPTMIAFFKRKVIQEY